MPNTSVWAIPYAGPNDAPNGYGQEEAIARAVEAGLTTVNTPPLCVLHNSNVGGAQNTPNAAGTVVLFDTEEADTHGMFNASTNGSKLTCVKAGWYAVSGSVTFAVNSTGSRFVSFVVNGPGPDLGRLEVDAVKSARPTSLTTSTMVKLAVGDYLQLQCFQTSGGVLGITAGRITAKFDRP